MKDPSINYYIQSAGKERKSYRVIMSVSFDGKRLIHYPGIVLDTMNWDKEKQITQGLHHSPEINSFLNKLRRNVLNIYRSLSIRYGEVSIKYFREQLDKVKIVPGREFNDSFIRFMEYVLLNKSKSSYRKCKSLYHKLRDFEERMSIDLNLEGADRHFIKQLQGYLLNEGLSEISIRSYIGILKWFLNWCAERNWLINRDFQSFRPEFSRQLGDERKKEGLFLNQHEFDRFSEYPIADRKKEHIRNIFCFMALSGLNLEQTLGLDRSFFDQGTILYSDKYGQQQSFKPQKKLTYLLSFYENKYFVKGTLFPSYSLPTINKYLKIIARECRLDRPVERFQGDKTGNSPLYENFTITLAKHTFILRAWDTGVPLTGISRVSGKSLEWIHSFIEKHKSKYHEGSA